MRLAIFALFLCIALGGCATYKQHSQCESPASRTVALMPFSSIAKGVSGQQAANWVALEFIEKGYTVIDSSFTTTTVSEAKFYESGLSNEVRSAFLAKNITTLVFGNINEFTCQIIDYTNFYGGMNSKNRCTVSLAAKMVDIATGKLLWELILRDSAEDKNLTAEDLMKQLIVRTNISGTLPAPAVASKELSKEPPKEPAK